MFTKIAVRWLSVLAVVVSGLFSGVAFAAAGGPACPLVSASIMRQECLASGASAVLPAQEQVVVSSQAVAYSAAETAQEEAVLSGATGNSLTFTLPSSQAATIDYAVQEEMVLSAGTGNSFGFALLAAQAAATAGAGLEYQPNDRSFHTPQTSDYRPADPSFHTPQTSDYQP